METQVIIVGAGVAGGSLACALAHRGINSIMIERRQNVGDLNRGDGMQPRSLEIIESWGLLNDFTQAGALPSYGLEIYHPVIGKVLEVDLGGVKAQYPYMLNLPHPQIENLLLKHVTKSKHCQILSGDVKEVLLENGRAVGVRTIVNQEEIVIKAPVVAGADGAQSLTRKSVEIAAPAATYTHDLLVLHAIRPNWFKGRLRTRVYMHQQGVLVLIPLPDDKLRIAAMIPAGTGSKWKKLSAAELSQQLSRRLPALVGVELEQHGDHIYRLQKMHVERYAYKGVVLLGDAAHITHPAAGLGMNMALQDADTLASELLRAFQGECSFDDAYSAYENIRRPINQNVINRANFMAWQMWSPTFLGFLGRSSIFTLLQVLPFIRQKLAKSLAWANAGIQEPT